MVWLENAQAIPDPTAHRPPWPKNHAIKRQTSRAMGQRTGARTRPATKWIKAAAGLQPLTHRAHNRASTVRNLRVGRHAVHCVHTNNRATNATLIRCQNSALFRSNHVLSLRSKLFRLPPRRRLLLFTKLRHCVLNRVLCVVHHDQAKTEPSKHKHNRINRTLNNLRHLLPPVSIPRRERKALPSPSQTSGLLRQVQVGHRRQPYGIGCRARELQLSNYTCSFYSSKNQKAGLAGGHRTC